MAAQLSLIHSQAKKKKKLIDKLVYVASVIGPLLTLPQIYTVWTTPAQGVSLFTWAGYQIYQVIWLWYAIVHKEKPLILVNSLWIIVQMAVILGILRTNY